MNGYAVITKSNRSFDSNLLAKAFTGHVDNANSFANFMLSEGQLSTIAVGKLGKTLFADPCNIRSSFYATENEEIMNDLLPEFGHFGRVVVIIRPLLVKSGLSEFCTHLLRLNGFVIIKVDLTIGIFIYIHP